MSVEDVRQFLDEHGTREQYPAVRFQEPGDTIKGYLVETPRVIDMNKGGKARRAMIVTITDDSDGQVKTLWVDRNSYLASAISDAVHEAQTNFLYEGGKLTVTFTHSIDVGKPSPARQYEVIYQPPTDEPF